MGRRIETKPGNFPKYRIWSTIVDGFLTGWLTKEEAVEWLLWDETRHRREEYKDFPNGFYDLDDNLIVIDQPNQAKGDHESN